MENDKKELLDAVEYAKSIYKNVFEIEDASEEEISEFIRAMYAAQENN